MNQEFKQKCKKHDSFIECQSAFGGFGIYKINKFKQCHYRSLVDLSLFNQRSINHINDIYNIQYRFEPHIYDCEHRYFHLCAIKKNNAKLFIYNKNLFPPYSGEHINILN